MATPRKRGTTGQVFPKRGEIYLAALDPALGYEIKKTRPALVIQNNVSNQYGAATIIAAITSKVSTRQYPNEVIIAPGRSGLTVQSTVRLDQIRTVDRMRLLKRLGQIDVAVMKQIDQAIAISLGLAQL